MAQKKRYGRGEEKEVTLAWKQRVDYGMEWIFYSQAIQSDVDYGSERFNALFSLSPGQPQFLRRQNMDPPGIGSKEAEFGLPKFVAL
jgi:hypothetical protein